MLHQILGLDPRGNKSHTRNRHLRNHRKCSGAFPNGFWVAFSPGMLLFCGMFQRIVTCPADCRWTVQMDCQWHFPMEFPDGISLVWLLVCIVIIIIIIIIIITNVVSVLLLIHPIINLIIIIIIFIIASISVYVLYANVILLCILLM